MTVFNFFYWIEKEILAVTLSIIRFADYAV